METPENGVSNETEHQKKSCNVFDGISTLCDCDMCNGMSEAEKTFECARAHLKKSANSDDAVVSDKDVAIEAITRMIEFCEKSARMRMDMGKTLSETMDKLLISQKTAKIGENTKAYVLNAGQALISKINELKVERGLTHEGTENDSEQVKNARKIVRDAVESIDFVLADWRREWIENIKEKDVDSACDPGMAEARAAWDKICGGETPDIDPNAPCIVADHEKSCNTLQD